MCHQVVPRLRFGMKMVLSRHPNKESPSNRCPWVFGCVLQQNKKNLMDIQLVCWVFPQATYNFHQTHEALEVQKMLDVSPCPDGSAMWSRKKKEWRVINGGGGKFGETDRKMCRLFKNSCLSQSAHSQPQWPHESADPKQDWVCVFFCLAAQIEWLANENTHLQLIWAIPFFSCVVNLAVNGIQQKNCRSNHSESWFSTHFQSPKRNKSGFFNIQIVTAFCV